MQYLSASVALAVALSCTTAAAEGPPEGITPKHVEAGAEIYAVNCSPCHGTRMQDAESAFDLRKFPRDQRERFIIAIVRGKNQMPAWGDMFKPDEIDALWAYVVTRERN
jgi:mono/diheme cytochrome c family protein